MFPIKTILHPTDFSKNSQRAWEAACALARDYQARLFVVHVIPPPPVFMEFGAVPPPPVIRTEIEQQLAEFTAPEPGLSVTRALLDGYEANEIVRYAERINADVIVMGTHGRSGLGRVLVGSVAEEVLRHAPCPVMTVKNTLPAQAQPCERCETAGTVG